MAGKSELPMALRAAYLALHRRSEAQFAKCGVTADQSCWPHWHAETH
jgi:hypothetical protein